MEEGEGPRATMPVIGGVTYSSTVAFEDVGPEHFRTIKNIPRFRRQAVLADIDSDFLLLDRYAWEGDF